MIKNTKTLILIGLPLLAAIIISLILQVTILSNPQKVTTWLSQFGPFVILVYAVLQAITVIIAPIGGFFLQVAMIALFKPAVALSIIYLVVTPLYLVNFYIARKYGKPLVSKIIGKTALERVDHLSKDAGVITLVILKVFQAGIFDYLSYAVGLTRIPFKTFAAVNIFGGIPGTMVSYFVLTKTDNLTVGIILLVVIAYTLGAFAIFLNHQFKKHKKI